MRRRTYTRLDWMTASRDQGRRASRAPSRNPSRTRHLALSTRVRADVTPLLVYLYRVLRAGSQGRRADLPAPLLGVAPALPTHEDAG